MTAPGRNPSARQTDAEGARIRREQGEAARALLTAHDAADLLDLLGIEPEDTGKTDWADWADAYGLGVLDELNHDGPGFYEHTDRVANLASDEAAL